MQAPVLRGFFVLSLYFAAGKSIHQSIAELDHGSELTLCRRNDGRPGWELADNKGVVISRMAKSFDPPRGDVLTIRGAAILARSKKPGYPEKLRCDAWEVVFARNALPAGQKLIRVGQLGRDVGKASGGSRYWFLSGSRRSFAVAGRLHRVGFKFLNNCVILPMVESECFKRTQD